LLSVSNIRSVSLEDKLRIQTLREQKRGAKAAVVDDHVWDAMLEANYKLKKKPSTIAELQTTLQKIWNQLPRKPAVVKAVQNFRKCLQVRVNKVGGHFEHFM